MKRILFGAFFVAIYLLFAGEIFAATTNMNFMDLKWQDDKETVIQKLKNNGFGDPSWNMYDNFYVKYNITDKIPKLSELKKESTPNIDDKTKYQFKTGYLRAVKELPVRDIKIFISNSTDMLSAYSLEISHLNNKSVLASLVEKYGTPTEPSEGISEWHDDEVSIYHVTLSTESGVLTYINNLAFDKHISKIKTAVMAQDKDTTEKLKEIFATNGADGRSVGFFGINWDDGNEKVQSILKTLVDQFYEDDSNDITIPFYRFDKIDYNQKLIADFSKNEDNKIVSAKCSIQLKKIINSKTPGEFEIRFTSSKLTKKLLCFTIEVDSSDNHFYELIENAFSEIHGPPVDYEAEIQPEYSVGNVSYYRYPSISRTRLVTREEIEKSGGNLKYHIAYSWGNETQKIFSRNNMLLFVNSSNFSEHVTALKTQPDKTQKIF